MGSKKYTIAVVGAGYVGLSMAVLLSQRNKTYIVDIQEERIRQISKRESPIEDQDIQAFLSNKQLDLVPTNHEMEAYSKSDFVIIATPTDYDEEKNSFDISSVNNVIDTVIKCNSEAVIIIKSTVSIGFTRSIRGKYRNQNILFSPEFLRETKALYDNLYPSRIIVGTDLSDANLCEKAAEFSELLKESAEKADVRTLIMGYEEAEAVKLFSNTYLALRVAYFNELDMFAEMKDLDTRQIISGVCLDPRIGNQYNNPSFGYGGYCLPKDSKQLLAEFTGVPNNLIEATVKSNKTRKKFIANRIIELSSSCTINREKE